MPTTQVLMGQAELEVVALLQASVLRQGPNLPG